MVRKVHLDWDYLHALFAHNHPEPRIIADDPVIADTGSFDRSLDLTGPELAEPRSCGVIRIVHNTTLFPSGNPKTIADGLRTSLGPNTFPLVRTWVSEIVTASLILIGLGQPPLFLESFVIQLILAILMMMPLTPGSSGIAEVGATSMYALFIPASVVGIFVVIWRIVLYYFNIALGILSSIIIVRREAQKAE